MAEGGTVEEAAKADDPRRRSVPERRAYTAARRDAAQERDADRYRLARELEARVSRAIPRGQGFAVVPPGGVATASAVVDAANELIDDIGHDALTARRTKGGYLATRFLPPEALTLDSPYLRLALDDAVVAPISAYLGLVPVLKTIDVWYSFPAGEQQPRASQRWHLDHADTTQVKVWVHCSDVGP